MDPLEYSKGEAAYRKCLMEQYENDPDSVNWMDVFDMLEELQADALYIDELQGEQSDWRFA